VDPRNIFSKTAEGYWKSTDHRSGPDLDRIRQIASDIMPTLTLDVATGAGHALRAAAPFSSLCAAVDVTMEMLRVAREHLSGAGLEHVIYTGGNAEALPFRESCVDLLCCRIACHHFGDLPLFLGEVNRVLAAEGQFVIVDSIVPDDEEWDVFMNGVEAIRDPSHVRSNTLGQWRSMLADSGLCVVHEEVFERRHPFGEWVQRAAVSGERSQRLEDKFRSAAERVKEKFQIKLDTRGKIISYTDEKAIFSGKLL